VKFLLIACTLITFGCSTPEAEHELLTGETRFNEPVPVFSKVTLSGETLTEADLKGKVTLVNFWATWCGPCIIETPDFVALQEEWKDRPFQIIGVSMDETGFEAVQPFVNDFMVNYPQILDEGPLADGFGGVWALPTTFLVDGDGQVQSSFLGLFPMEKRRDYLDKLVKELES
jgi:thiol-disulfide isomerase/thioredoxin